MKALYDYHWSLEEQSFAQGVRFLLIGLKGQVNSYPTIPLSHPEEFYSRDEALLNATVAANAPYMLRMLEKLARYMKIPAEDDPMVRSWREEILAEIAAATG